MSYQINQHFFPSTQIYLNSKYADAYGDVPSKKSWCYFNFKEPIVKLPMAYDFLISLDSAEIPCSFFAVNASNNSITFNVQYTNSIGTSFNETSTTTLANGNYSAIDLASIITSKVLNANNYYYIKCSYNTTTNLFSYQVNSLNSTNCSNITSFSILAGSPNSIFGLSGRQLLSTNNINNTITLVSDAGVDLAGTRAIYIKCVNIHTQAYDSRTKYSGTTLARIPVIEEPLGIVFWNNSTGFKAKCSLKNVANLEIQVVDEFGNFVDFNNVDWTATIQLDILAGSPTDYVPDTPGF